jgi:hypothetical protein
VTLAAYGLVLSDGSYDCVFYDGAFLIAAANSTATSHTSITCLTPAWGRYQPAGSTTVILRHGADDLNPVSPVGSAEFEFIVRWKSFTSTTKYGAKGGDRLDFEAAGLTSTYSYKCYFESTTNANHYLESTATYESVSALSCATPAWGKTYTDTVADVYVIEVAGSTETTVAQWARFGTLASSEFSFYRAWDRVSPTSVSALGGDVISLRTYGTLSHAYYVCAFQDVSHPSRQVVSSVHGGLLLSGPDHDSNEINCTVPAWGALYPAAVVNVSLYRVDKYAALNLSTVDIAETVVAVGNATINVTAEWDQLSYDAVYGAKGGDVITLSGAGFDPDESDYFCAFVGTSGTTGARIVEFSADTTPGHVTNVTCVTPGWSDMAATARVHLFKDYNRIPATNSTDTRFRFFGTPAACSSRVACDPCSSAVWDALSPHVGNSSGGTRVAVSAYGFSTAFDYFLKFTDESDNSTVSSNLFSPVSDSKLVATTPAWVDAFFANTTVSVYRQITTVVTTPKPSPTPTLHPTWNASHLNGTTRSLLATRALLANDSAVNTTDDDGLNSTIVLQDTLVPFVGGSKRAQSFAFSNAPTTSPTFAPTINNDVPTLAPTRYNDTGKPFVEFVEMNGIGENSANFTLRSVRSGRVASPPRSNTALLVDTATGCPVRCTSRATRSTATWAVPYPRFPSTHRIRTRKRTRGHAAPAFGAL